MGSEGALARSVARLARHTLSLLAWEMLKDIGDPHFYQFYILVSAYTHTNFEAGSLYRKNLRCGKELGEFIIPQDWRLPLEVARKSFFLIARDFLYWVEADMASILNGHTSSRL